MKEITFMITRRNFLQFSSQLIGSTLLAGAWPACAATQAKESSSLVYASVAKLKKHFAKGTISPLQVLEAQIDRIHKFNKAINCITFEHFDEARTAARIAEKRYKNGNPRSLEGITIAIKDEYAVKGWITTMGSLLLKEEPPLINMTTH